MATRNVPLMFYTFTLPFLQFHLWKFNYLKPLSSLVILNLNNLGIKPNKRFLKPLRVLRWKEINSNFLFTTAEIKKYIYVYFVAWLCRKRYLKYLVVSERKKWSSDNLNFRNKKIRAEFLSGRLCFMNKLLVEKVFWSKIINLFPGYLNKEK